ncbi:hypothetical protein VTI74DRAFT_1623 [Chaetomium olivicolor]
MCTIGHTRFACGCIHADPETLRKCEWAKLKGRRYVCPDFQVGEDKSRSRTVQFQCLEHTKTLVPVKHEAWQK